MSNMHQDIKRQLSARVREVDSQFMNQVGLPVRRSFTSQASPYDEAFLSSDAMDYLKGKDCQFQWQEELGSVVLGAAGFTWPTFRGAFPNSREAFGRAESFNPGWYASEGVEHLGRQLVAEGKILAFACGENVDRVFRLDPSLFKQIGAGVGRPAGFYAAIYLRCDFMEKLNDSEASDLKLDDKTNQDWREIASSCPEWELPHAKNGWAVREIVSRVMSGDVPSAKAGAELMIQEFGAAPLGKAKKGMIISSASNPADLLARNARKLLIFMKERGISPY